MRAKELREMFPDLVTAKCVGGGCDPFTPAMACPLHGDDSHTTGGALMLCLDDPLRNTPSKAESYLATVVKLKAEVEAHLDPRGTSVYLMCATCEEALATWCPHRRADKEAALRLLTSPSVPLAFTPGMDLVGFAKVMRVLVNKELEASLRSDFKDTDAP